MGLVWDGVDSVDARPANVVLVQEMEGDFLVSFGYAPPPVALMPLDEQESQKYLDKHGVKVNQLTRILLKKHAAAILVGTLENNQSLRAIITAISEPAQQEQGSDSGD